MSGNDQQKKKRAEPLIVITTVAGFPDKERNINRRIYPVRIMRRSGQVHRVEKIRQWHEEFVGHGHRQVHVTVQTEDMRMLDVVFDTRKIGWYLVHEEAGMMLD